MFKVGGLRVLAVPAAVGLAGVLVLACIERNPTAPLRRGRAFARAVEGGVLR